MTLSLPKPVTDYIEANARLDVDGMLQPFAQDAIFLDNKRHFQGHTELRTLLANQVVAVKAIFTSETVRHDGAQIVVEGPAHGNFPGSPIRFTYRFTLESDRIKTLEVTG
jgi:hypothetical protein